MYLKVVPWVDIYVIGGEDEEVLARAKNRIKIPQGQTHVSVQEFKRLRGQTHGSASTVNKVRISHQLFYT